jgi:hypothetical protein
LGLANLCPKGCGKHVGVLFNFTEERGGATRLPLPSHPVKDFVLGVSEHPLCPSQNLAFDGRHQRVSEVEQI